MAAWASLSGYLYFKPGGGALSRLKAKKKLWCVLDENKCQVVYHKSEDDARCKPPLGSIELRGAAITLDLDNQNQFVIIVDGKEAYLTAENHESMMIWLMALQAKRDLFAKYETRERHADGTAEDQDHDTAAHYGIVAEEETRERVGSQTWHHDTNRKISQPCLDSRGLVTSAPNQPANRHRHNSTSSSDVSVVREGGHRTLCATKSLQNPQHIADGSLAAQVRRHQMMRLGETFDNGRSGRREEAQGSSFHPFSRQLSISMEGSELLQRQHQRQHNSGYHNLNSSHGNNINFNAGPAVTSSRVAGSSSSASTVESDELLADDQARRRCSSKHLGDITSTGPFLADVSRDSSLSASSDSAIDKGDNTDLVARVHELEAELITSKCELAKVMNRQTCFQEILKQKDEIILDLDEKLGKLGGADIGYDSKKRSLQTSKEQQERVRILQNQNRFLNEEVRRLARLRSQEQTKIKEQDGNLSELEGTIELWKLQYVSLIQSSIRFTGSDTMDDAELSLYGGDRHKNKVRALLEEARKINPSLPTYENLAAGEVHVDYYGFKHQFQDSGLLLHYLCQELTQHYLTQASAHEQHYHRWHNYLRTNAKCIMKNRKELKELCRAGIPDQFRKQVWRSLIHDQVAEIMAEKGNHYYRSLCSTLPDSPLAARYRKQISLDLMRTMPGNVKFSTQGSKGVMDLQDVLLAFCIHNPNVGYCQGMNFLVAMALLFMDAQDAFWTLVAVTEKYHSISYFDQHLLGAQADQKVLAVLLGDLLPELARHLEAIDIEISTVTLNWFLAIFFDAVPFHTLLRIWDCFLLEGPKVLFRFSLAILKLHEREIIKKCETISVMRHLKACAKVTYDVDGLVQLAFKGLKPFPRRQDINSKQMVYLKALKEKYRWRELQKLAFAERESLFLSLESHTGNALTFECSVVSNTGCEAWVCYGNQTQCKVCVVDCKEGTMTDIPIQFSCRVMSLCAIPNAILFGTLSWNICCYREADRILIWEQQLHDAVLSLCAFEDSGTWRVFAGLADGTVAVLENVNVNSVFYDVMYIPIGQSPVTCVRLLDSQLWCACGNTVSVIHASTLDAMDSFTVSSNPYDHILTLQPGLPGVWISVRGSSILELWDPDALVCKMLYDTRASRYPNLRKDDEMYFNKARITCILPLDYTVWVGTGEGNLITYDVFTHQGSKSPSDCSSFVGSYSDNFSALMSGKEEMTNLSSCAEAYDPVREAAMKVRQLYLAQVDSDTDPLRLSERILSCSDSLISSGNESVIQGGQDSSSMFFTQPTNESNSSKNNLLQETSGLAPSVNEDDIEGITPTPSFCCDNIVEAKSENKDSERQDENFGGSRHSETVEDNDSGEDKKSKVSSCSTGHHVVWDETAFDEKDFHSCDKFSEPNNRSGYLEQTREVYDTSLINGVHKFFIGDDGAHDTRRNIIDDNMHSERLDDSGNECDPSTHSAKVKTEEKGTAMATDGTNIDLNSGGSSPMTEAGDMSYTQVTEKELLERQTSESGIEMASSDGSVIMQVWDGIKDMKKNKSQTLCNSDIDTDEKEASRKPHIKDSMGSSFASSVESRQSESDEVFQDASDGLSTASTMEDSATTPVATAVEESQYETSQEELTEKAEQQTSAQEFVNNNHSSGLSDSKDLKGQKKKRPQSLFLQRNPKNVVRSVDKKAEKPIVRKTSVAAIKAATTMGTGSLSSPLPSTSRLMYKRSASESSVTDNLQPADLEAQYRLDYTNLHVETDIESVCTDHSPDSRRSSSVFSDFKLGSSGNLCGRLTRPDSFEESQEGGVILPECDPSSFIFPQDFYSEIAGPTDNAVRQKLLDMQKSRMFQPRALSTISCHTWSSYEEVSTPSRAECESLLSGKNNHGINNSKNNSNSILLPRNNSMLSTSTSIASTTELLYAADMTLMSKNKISDKPVKCLLLYKFEGKPLVLSFSGCHCDDEAVLKWSREKDQMLWTNDPILDYNPATKTTKLPTYMRARPSSSSSLQTLKQRLSQSSQ
ncbi:uncharacterized protein LOC112576362 isoform X3 [Pomacea canaliculata]|uniref:uncharacterized protein LOC112576362 isoform X3 n=1 Tax=Pomacea canaliculata TaxID=400727 RepID=UPI000D735380|nr:uncharacterized protein LOC112576362 isoform X3 [Pomacea canaliculata]